MASSPALRRGMYRALLSGARLLEAEVARYEVLRARELALLLRAASPRAGNAPPTAMSTSASPVAAVRAAARAPAAARDEFADDAFRVLRHVHDRVHALERLVYDVPESESVSFGVRVCVATSHARYESASRRFVYSYSVTMTNESEDTVQLLSRRWEIADLEGRVEEVVGPGVVGEFPILKPGETYQYSSGGSIQGSGIGTQSGHFLFVRHCDRVGDNGGCGSEAIVVDVAPFSLRAEEDEGWISAMSERGAVGGMEVRRSGGGGSGKPGGTTVFRSLRPAPGSPSPPSSPPSAPSPESPESAPPSGAEISRDAANANNSASGGRMLGRRLRRRRPKTTRVD
jgi:ApaG protein